MCRRLSIFPSRYQLSIFDASELNYCVRNGNRWTLTAIDTDCVDERELSKLNNETRFDINLNLGLSPRPISTRKLNVSLRLHIEPINLVVYKGSYLLKAMGYLILGTASRLDAFSVYPIRT